MKKIYLFLLALFGVFGFSNASAQSSFDWSKYDRTADINSPIIEDVWQFSSPMSDSGEGNFYSLLDRLDECPEDQHPNNDFWHSNWHDGNQTPGTHYFQVEIIDPEVLPEEIVFVFTRRPADNDHTTEWSVRGTNDSEAAKDACEELAYIVTPFSNNSETLTSDAFNPKGYKYLRFYSEVQHPSSRGYFHLSRFQLYPIVAVEEWEACYNMLSDVFNHYFPYAEEGYFPVGYEAGQYGAEEVAKLQKAVEVINVYLEGGVDLESLTKAKAEELANACETAYQAVLDSQVTFALSSGYYHIKAGLEYVNSVVVGQDEEGNDITEDQVCQKYLMGHKQSGKLWGIWANGDWGQNETEAAARTLWKITNNGDGTYDMVNVYNDARFLDVSRSGNAEMSTESTNTMAFDPVATTEDGINYVNIRVSTQPANDYVYLHQGGHGGGTGENGFLVGWCKTYEASCGASEWYFEKVDDAEAEKVIADWEPMKKDLENISKIKEMIAEANADLEIAKDVQKVFEGEGLITDAAQFSSPFSQNDLGNADGGNLSDGVLIDGDKGTFWHSYWGGGSVDGGTHYLQVEIVDDDVTTVAFKGYRRNADNDHTSVWTVWGSNDADYANELGKEGCEFLDSLSTPYGSPNEYIESPVFDTKGYKYIRFYSEEETGSSQGTRGYWHQAEFQLYRAHMYQSETNQYAMMGALATDLEAVIAEISAKEDDALTVDDYDKLKAALDAFKEKFVDPAALREAIANAEGSSDIIEVGTQPGFWPDKSAGDALDAYIASAKTYDESGVYSPAQSEEIINTLNSLKEGITEAAIKVEEGKWYRLRFGTEEEYAEHEWPTSGDEEDVDDAGNVKNEALFGKYVVVASFESTDGYNSVVQIAPDDVVLNNYVFLDADEDIVDKDMSLWRFINVGDSAYIIQNKASGLFIHGDGNVRMSASPSLFLQHIVGYGQNAFFAKRVDGVELTPLHSARNYNILCTWGGNSTNGGWRGYGDSDGRRGCFYVEEVEDVDPSYDGTEFNIAAVPGTVNSYCFPTAVEAENGMYALMSAETTEEGINVTLCPIQKAAAGQPFIFVTEGEYDSEAEAELYPFTHGYDIVTEASAKNNLNGTLYGATVGKGVITISNNQFSVTKSPSATVGECQAYITNGEDVFNEKLTVSFVIDPEGDGIQAALENVARTGAIYTIDGRLVTKKGNLNSLRQKGIYIVNGTKVIVK